MRTPPSGYRIDLRLAGPAEASHDESLGARFVQPGGIDAGNCLDHHAPCVSIRYALAQAEPGNTVKVGAGIFDLTGIDPETYLHGPVHATGGYDELDHYLESRPSQVRSIVTGVDARYRHALAVRGFHWAESAAAARRGVVSFGGRRRFSRSARQPPPCTQGAPGQFPCRNLDFQSQIPLAQLSSAPVSAANVWGFVDLNDNREYAVLGTTQRHGHRRGHRPRRIRARSSRFPAIRRRGARSRSIKCSTRSRSAGAPTPTSRPKRPTAGCKRSTCRACRRRPRSRRRTWTRARSTRCTSRTSTTRRTPRCRACNPFCTSRAAT